MHRTLGIAAVIVGILALLGGGRVLATCDAATCVYMPMAGNASELGVPAGTVVHPASTPLPTPAAPTPGPYYGCEQNQPLPSEGLQVWLSNLAPGPRDATNVCVRLAVNGRYVYGAPGQVVFHAANHDTVRTFRTVEDASFLAWYDPSPVNAGISIVVDVAVTYLDRIYLAQTSFVTAPYVTDTPTPSATPTDIPSATPTSTSTPSATPTSTPSATPTV